MSKTVRAALCPICEGTILAPQSVEHHVKTDHALLEAAMKCEELREATQAAEAQVTKLREAAQAVVDAVNERHDAYKGNRFRYSVPYGEVTRLMEALANTEPKPVVDDDDAEGERRFTIPINPDPVTTMAKAQRGKKK